MDWLKKIFQKAQNIGVRNKVSLGLDVLETSFPQYFLLKERSKHLSLLDCGRILDVQSDCARLRKLSTSVTVAIPRDKMILRVLNIPNISSDQMMDAVIEEAQHSLPFRLVDLAWQYSVVRSSVDSTQVLFAAVEKKMVSIYRERLREMGFKNVDMTVSTLAYLNCFLYNYQDRLEGENYLLLDIGMRQIEICILSKGEIVLTRSLNLGAEYIIRLIAEYLNVDFSVAQNMMFSPKNVSDIEGEDIESRLREAFNVWIERLLKELELASRFFTTKRGENTSKIVMSGCSFDLTYDRNYIAEVLRNHFNKDVEFLDPTMNLILDEKSPLDSCDIQDSAMFVSMGLSLQSTAHAQYQINFNQKTMLGPDKKIKSHYVIKSLLALIAIFLVLCVANILSTMNLNAQCKKLQEQLDKKTRDIGLQKEKYIKVKKTLDSMNMKPSILIDLKMFVEHLPLNMIATHIQVKQGFLFVNGYVNEKIEVDPYSEIQQAMLSKMKMTEKRLDDGQAEFMKPFTLQLEGDR